MSVFTTIGVMSFNSIFEIRSMTNIMEIIFGRFKNINKKGFHYIVSAGGLEPPTLCLKGRCSTPELRALF